MPIPVTRFDTDGSLLPISNSSIVSYDVRSRGVRDGSSPVRELGIENSTKSLKYFISPDHFFDTMVYFLGAVAFYPNGDGKQRLSRIMPYAHPDEPLVGCTHVRSMGFNFKEDVNDVGGIPLPSHYEVDCDLTMEPLPFEVKADFETANEMERYVEVLPDEPEAQYLTMPGITTGILMKKDVAGNGPDGTAGGLGANYSIGFPIIKARVSRKWHRLPKEVWEPDSVLSLYKRYYGDGTNRGYIGTVNSVAIWGMPAGTAVLEAPAIERKFDSVSSTWAINITNRWLFTPVGSCKLYYFKQTGGAGTSGWYYATRGAWNATGVPAAVTGDGESLFDARDHRDLYVVGDV